MTSQDATAPPQPFENDAELARLRSEVARLEAERSGRSGRSGRSKARTGWWRPLVAGALVMIAALLAPLSVLATWAHGQVEDTDRYVQTVGPLAGDPDVQDAIAVRVEQIVFGYLDIDAATEELVAAINQQGLPEPAATTLQAAVGPLAAGIRSFVSARIHQLVESAAFEEAWIAANREAHSQLVMALTGEGDTVTVDRGEVTVGLASIIDAVREQLVAAGFAIADRIPDVDATFTILRSDDLGTVQKVLGVLDDLSRWLPVIGLGLLAVAVMIARDRRRTVLAAGMAVAASMLLLGGVLNVIRPFYLDALPASSSTAAAGAVYDQLVSFIRLALRGVLVLAVAIAIGAWLSATQGAGATARVALVRGIDAVRRGGGRAGLDTGRLGLVLARYRSAVRTVVVTAAAIWYLSLDHPTGNTALVFVVATVVCLLVAELLAAGPGPTHDELAVDDGHGR
jgi:hypothetical protein